MDLIIKNLLLLITYMMKGSLVHFSNLGFIGYYIS